MAYREHPLETKFFVTAQADGTYRVEAQMPGSSPSILTSFPTEAEAKRWVADYRLRHSSRSEETE
jgi:hypothetical protein